MVSQVANQIKAFAAVCGMILRITCNAKNDIYIYTDILDCTCYTLFILIAQNYFFIEFIVIVI